LNKLYTKKLDLEENHILGWKHDSGGTKESATVHIQAKVAKWEEVNTYLKCTR
jgi:hypothetical protein